MFERNRVCNSTEAVAVAAELTLDTGETVAGRVIISRSKDLAATLNGPEGFVTFETYGGQKVLLAKSAIRMASGLDVPSAAALPSVRDSDGFDPYAILGVARGASLGEVRAAFHKLSKAYHPDRYAAADLPDEVAIYLAAMSRRVNTAFEVLEEELTRLNGRPKAVPVYESSRRF